MDTSVKDTSKIHEQLEKQRRTVDFDTFDILVQQLLSMLGNGAIDIAPVYQRQFRWDDTRCSQLVESFFLGIPVPSLFMATNKDGTWELVDGVQRLSSLVKFAGSDELRKKLNILTPLRLDGLEKLSQFDGLTFADLPRSVQLQFELRPVKVVTLKGESAGGNRHPAFCFRGSRESMLTAIENDAKATISQGRPTRERPFDPR